MSTKQKTEEQEQERNRLFSEIVEDLKLRFDSYGREKDEESELNKSECSARWFWEYENRGGEIWVKKGNDAEWKEMPATDAIYEIMNLRRKLTPFTWTIKESEAWHRSIPDLHLAFRMLLNK